MCTKSVGQYTRAPATGGRKHKVLITLTLHERESLRLAAAYSDCTVQAYLMGLHEARGRGEIFPDGAQIIHAALALITEAQQAATELAKMGYPRRQLRQTIVDLESTIRNAGRPLPSRR